MSAFRKWRENLCDRFINKNAHTSNTWRFVDYESARSVAILFNCTTMESRNQVTTFAKQLGKKGKQVKLLGFLDDQPNREMHLPFNFFTRKDLRFNLMAKGNHVERFLEKPFDILLSVYHDDCYPIRALSALSKAKIRLGPVTENTKCFDIMVDGPETSGYTAMMREYDHILQQMVQKDVFVKL